jgi:hypothetical protein
MPSAAQGELVTEVQVGTNGRGAGIMLQSEVLILLEGLKLTTRVSSPIHICRVLGPGTSARPGRTIETDWS